MIATLAAVNFPLVFWGAFRLTLPSVVFELDFDLAHATFFFLYDRYARTIWTIFWVGILGSIAYQHFVGHGDAPVFLMASGIYALLFNVWVLTTYERYLHQRYPRIQNVPGISNYTSSKYALTLALGATTVLLFVLGLLTALVGLGA